MCMFLCKSFTLTVLQDWDGSSWNLISTMEGADFGLGNKDAFGYTTTISGDGQRLCVSTPRTNSNTGQVQLFQWDGSTFGQMGSTITGDNTGDRLGLKCELNDDGSSFIVNTWMNTDGYVKVFDWSGTWTQRGPSFVGEAGEGLGEKD